MNWFRHYGLGLHAGECLTFAMVILVALVLVIWLLTPERDADESNKDYWGTH